MFQQNNVRVDNLALHRIADVKDGLQLILKISSEGIGQQIPRYEPNRVFWGHGGESHSIPRLCTRECQGTSGTFHRQYNLTFQVPSVFKESIHVKLLHFSELEGALLLDEL
jgi:hypothetical protein